MLFFIIILVLGLVALSVIVGGGLNFEFLKILLILAIGILVVFALKKIYDSFKK